MDMYIYMYIYISIICRLNQQLRDCMSWRHLMSYKESRWKKVINRWSLACNLKFLKNDGHRTKSIDYWKIIGGAKLRALRVAPAETRLTVYRRLRVRRVLRRHQWASLNLAASRQIYDSGCVFDFVLWICEFVLAFEAWVWNFKVQRIFLDRPYSQENSDLFFGRVQKNVPPKKWRKMTKIKEIH